MDWTTLLKVFAISILYSIPATYLYTCFCFVGWGHPLRPNRLKIAIFGITQPLIGNLFFLVFPAYLHALYYSSAFMVLFFIIFYRMTFRDRLKIAVTCYLMGFCIETAIAMLMFVLFTEKYLEKDPIVIAASSMPVLIVIWYVTNRMEQRKIAIFKNTLSKLGEKLKRSLTLLILIMALQFIILGAGFYYQWIDQSLNHVAISGFSLISCLISLIIVILAAQVISQTKDESIRLTQEHYIQDIHRMFTTVRGQRHDFLNHAQVIFSMLKKRSMTIWKNTYPN